MNYQYQQQQQQQYQYQQPNRGILPSSILESLDALVDRLNASSGYSLGAANSATHQHPPIRALLVGTNEGIGLARCLGASPTAADGGASSYMSEEVLSSVESIWATLPSSTPPHVMAAAAASGAGVTATSGGVDGENGGGGGSAANVGGEARVENETAPGHHQPPHPLLRPLGMGDEIRTVMAFYDNCTLMHVHMSPLVVTIIATPNANVGSLRTTALPILRNLLEPVRQSAVRSRGGGVQNAASAAGSSQVNMAAQHALQPNMNDYPSHVGEMAGEMAYNQGGSMMMAGADVDEYYTGR
uniref:Uncharacterized protein n=1 Tax=Helicotheca tamesis TaxID=374047 RepID=A0A7S2HKK1_9STRA|mmetsp:Transcript_18949/g.26094  ORF Transcript_18949/g.26094 Transcript_18949/m.26094 type:complete len:300 (+) Transcript_18949:54-953(+)